MPGTPTDNDVRYEIGLLEGKVSQIDNADPRRSQQQHLDRALAASWENADSPRDDLSPVRAHFRT